MFGLADDMKVLEIIDNYKVLSWEREPPIENDPLLWESGQDLLLDMVLPVWTIRVHIEHFDSTAVPEKPD